MLRNILFSFVVIGSLTTVSCKSRQYNNSDTQTKGVIDTIANLPHEVPLKFMNSGYSIGDKVIVEFFGEPTTARQTLIEADDAGRAVVKFNTSDSTERPELVKAESYTSVKILSKYIPVENMKINDGSTVKKGDCIGFINHIDNAETATVKDMSSHGIANYILLNMDTSYGRSYFIASSAVKKLWPAEKCADIK